MSIEIKVRYVDLNKLFGKEKEIAHYRFVDSVEHCPIVVEKILKILGEDEGVTVFDSRDENMNEHAWKNFKQDKDGKC
jgi:hypothetical protein